MSIDFNDAISWDQEKRFGQACVFVGSFPWSFDEKNLHKNASNVFLLWCFDRMLDAPKC